MTERRTFLLREPVQAHKALAQVWLVVKASLIAGHRMVLELRPETRSDAQNKLLHAWIGEIAKSIEWAGKKRSGETWKRLLVASWLRARGESVEILPALDGYGIDVVFRHTSTLTKAECSELCDFVIAWATEHGVGQSIDPETGEIT